MSVKRQGAKAVVMNGKLFVVGGFDDRRYHKSGEFYNPDTDCWERQPDMNLSRADFSFSMEMGLSPSHFLTLLQNLCCILNA